MNKTSAICRKLAALASATTMLACGSTVTAHATDLSFWCLTVPGIDGRQFLVRVRFASLQA
jgi:hypothetical protein